MPSQAATTEVPVLGLARETVWLDKHKYEEAERQYHEQQQQQQQQQNTGRGETASGGPSGDVASTGRSAVTRKQSKKQQQQQQLQRQQSEKALADTNPEKEATAKEHQQQQPSCKKRGSKKGGGGDAKEGSSSSKASGKKSADKPIQPPPEVAGCETSNTGSLLVDEISRAKQHIKNSLQSHTSSKPAAGGQTTSELNRKIAELEAETDRLNGVTDDLRALVLKLETRISALEQNRPTQGRGAALLAAITSHCSSNVVENVDEDKDDVDLFGSDEEDDEEKERLHQERLKAYEAKKSKKPALIAKSNIVLDIKPWDDETDMKEMEKQVRTIAVDGLVWGASKLVPLAYGIHKLQISCVVEDDKVSVDHLQEQIEGFEELVRKYI